MIDDHDRIPLPPESVPKTDTPRRDSIVTTWIAYYVIAFLLLLVTTPATSHSDNWSGVVPAFGIVMFGAYRLTSAGATLSTSFIYGCGTSLLFVYRFLSMGRFSLWLQSSAPSTAAILAIWCVICLALGTSTAGLAAMIRHVDEPADSLDSNQR